MKIKYAEPSGYFNKDMEKAFKSAVKKSASAKKQKKTDKKGKK